MGGLVVQDEDEVKDEELKDAKLVTIRCADDRELNDIK